VVGLVLRYEGQLLQYIIIEGKINGKKIEDYQEYPTSKLRFPMQVYQTIRN